MPTYEYKCGKCRKTFEEFQSIKDPALKECVFCKGPVKRVISPVGISFKGPGFYATDNSKKADKTDKHDKTKAAAAAPAPKTEPAAK